MKLLQQTIETTEMNKAQNTLKKYAVLALFLLLGLFTIQAQTCPQTTRNSWEWMGHNNWFTPIARPNNATNYVLNQRTGVMQAITNPAMPAAWDIGNIAAYQGVATASNDRGELVFFCNGRSAFRADGTVITNGILAGNECGSQVGVTSAVHGTMIVRHPLQPLYYYIITIDDVVAQGCPNAGITVAIIDSSANLIQNSLPIEQNIPSGLQGKLRTTEGFAATFHGNGVDIWITFHPLGETHTVTYLLTCDGFVTPPVISINGMVPSLAIAEGVGDMDFSPDGTKLAVGSEVSNPDGYGTITLFDFDNWTGKISAQKRIYPMQWQSQNMYNLIFDPNGTDLHFQGTGRAGKLDISSNDEATIRAAGFQASAYLSQGFEAAAINHAGVITPYDRNRYPETAASAAAVFSANDMYIPPLEEPDIQEAASRCDTFPDFDLHTYWLCSGVSSEDTIYSKHNYYLLDSNDASGATIDPSSAAIIGQKTGIFSPSKAGAGTHKIVFVYCGVNDTIDIVITKCASCIDTLFNNTPELCAGPGATLNLATLVDTANAKGYWTFGTSPTTPAIAATIDSSTTDTLFSAIDPTTSYGLYNMVYTVTNAGLECKDSINIIVNKPPVVEVNDSIICVGNPDALFTAVVDSAVAKYTWGDNGTGTSQTTTGAVAGIYTIVVEDDNGCIGKDTGLLIVNAVPKISVNDSTICSDGGPALFTATSDTTASNYLWGDNGSGTSSTTTGTVAGIYSVLVIDKNGCVGRDTGLMVINKVPVVSINDSTICAGDPAAMFTATVDSAVTTYAWADEGSGSAATTTGTTAGLYTITITDVHNCVAKDTGELFVNALPVVTVNDSTICAGGTVSALFTATSDTTATSYLWSANGSGTASTFAGTIPGSYTVTVTDKNTCVGTGTGVLKVSALPVVSVDSSEICVGDAAATFNVTSDTTVFSYIWSDNATGTAAAASGTVAGDYTVTIMDVNGCEGTAKGLLTVHDLPVVNLQGGNVCPGTPFTLDPIVTTSNLPVTYAWGSGETSATVQKGQGTFTVTVTDAKNCVGTDNAVIIEDPSLTVVIPGPISICQGEDTLLISNYKAVDGYTFAWALGITPTGDVTESINVNATGLYGVVVNKGACTGTATVQVTVNARPTVTVNNEPICIGDAAATFTATSVTATSYLWSEEGSGTAGTTSGTTAGDYTVIVEDVNTCKDTATGVLTVNPLPTVSVSAQEICAGATATFTATSATATGYVWSGVGSGTNPTSTATAPGTATVVVTDANSCVGTDDALLIVNKLPVVTITGAAICAGAAANMVANSDSVVTTYAWSGLGTGNQQTESANVPGNYIVDILDLNGCTGSANANLAVEALPLVDDKSYSLCTGEPAVLVGDAITGGTYTYLWSSGETTDQVSKTAGIVLTRVATSVPGGCFSTTTYTVVENQNPSVTVADDTKCANEVITLNDTQPAAGFSYLWTPGNLTGSSITPTSTTTYSVTKTDDVTTCSTTINATATFIAIPNVSINGPDTVPICEGQVASVSATHDASSILWDNNAAANLTTYTTQGIKTVTVSNGGCPATDDVYVKVIQYPVSTLDKSMVGKLICFEELDTVLYLEAHTSSQYTYLWSTGETTNRIEPVDEGTYSVTITAEGQCPTPDVITLTGYCPWALNGPNAFTPGLNPDGLNDVFYAYGHNIISFEMTVFDRWGMKVFETDDINKGWDGSYFNNIVQMDVYVWKANFTVKNTLGTEDDYSRTGTVTVVR